MKTKDFMMKSRTKGLRISDLIVTLIIVVILAFFVYAYLMSYVTKKIHKLQIYLRTPYIVTPKPKPLKDPWGGEQFVLDPKHPGDLLKFFPHAFPESEDVITEPGLLPVEYYLEDQKRPSVCDACFKFGVNHVIENDVCFKGDVVMLVLITSPPENFERRKAIRETWLSPFVANDNEVRHLFVLGLSEMIKYDEIVREENDIHHDILQGDFIEDYHNLTYKTLTGLNWAVNNCHSAKVIFKVDDDVWLNVQTAVELFRHPRRKLLFGGKCISGIEPVRSPGSKWYASFQSYPEVHYPPYCSGPGYFLSVATASKILSISPNIPYFHLEDVYMGMCLKELKHQIRPLKGFVENPRDQTPCFHKYKSIVLVHGVTAREMRIVWANECKITKRQKSRWRKGA